ncbi:MAG TPA: hypothetical protein VK689_04640, partial [Armatimonadota bacterium]|nr:hypothetical protein [Armatimonadota bacterium]
QLQRLQRKTPSAGRASQSMQQAGNSLGQSSQSLSQGEQSEALSQEQKAMQQMQRAMQSLQQAMAESQKNDDPFAELRKALTKLAARQKAINGAVRRVDEEQQGGAQPDDAAELGRLARQQSEVEAATGALEPELPGDVFKSFSRGARSAMTRARDGLQAGNPKANPTQRSGQRAQTLLEQLAKALDADPKDNSQGEGGGGGGGQGGGGQQPDPEIAKRIAEIRLLRFMEQGIRSQTQELDDARPERTPLTEAQGEQLRDTAQQQEQAKALAERLAGALGRSRTLAGKVNQAGKHMGEAQRGLDKQETGEGVQEQEGQAIIRLTEALREAQKQAQQQSQSQQQQQAQRQQQGQKPGQQQGANQPAPGTQQQGGSSPAMQSLRRRSNGQGGALGEYGPDARGFAGLDPRGQDALRQGAKEKKPAEYQDLINRYFSALSNKGR